MKTIYSETEVFQMLNTETQLRLDQADRVRNALSGLTLGALTEVARVITKISKGKKVKP